MWAQSRRRFLEVPGHSFRAELQRSWRAERFFLWTASPEQHLASRLPARISATTNDREEMEKPDCLKDARDYRRYTAAPKKKTKDVSEVSGRGRFSRLAGREGFPFSSLLAFARESNVARSCAESGAGGLLPSAFPRRFAKKVFCFLLFPETQLSDLRHEARSRSRHDLYSD